MTATTFDTYTVEAYAETGEWLGEPEYTGEAVKSEWYAKQDTKEVHFDTFEHEDETCGIEVRWIYS